MKKILEDVRWLSVKIDGPTDDKLRMIAALADVKICDVVRVTLDNYLEYAADRLLEAK